MAATRLAQGRNEPHKANGADTADRDGELTGFGVRVRKNHVFQTRARGKLRWFTFGQRGRVTPDETTVVSRIASGLWL